MSSAFVMKKGVPVGLLRGWSPSLLLSLLLVLFCCAGRVMALPDNVSPRMETLRGTVLEVVPIQKETGRFFVRVLLSEGTDEAKVAEIHKAIRQRTNFDIRGQKRPKKGEALIVIDEFNAGKVPALKAGDEITITGYGVTDAEQQKGGRIAYEKVVVK